MSALPTVSFGASLVVLMCGSIAAAQSPTPTLAAFSFGAPRLYAAGTEPVAVAAGFFNPVPGSSTVADPYLDLAVVNYGGDSVMQFVNDGTGRFNRSGAEIVERDSFPTWIATLRKNNSNFHSMLMVRGQNENESETAEDFFGRAETLRAGPVLMGPPETVGENPVFVRTGTDLNLDGSEDAVVVNGDDDTLSLLLNHAVTGGYATETIATVSYPVGVALGDFTGDGLPDIASLGGGGDLLVHRNLGGATFVKPRFVSCIFGSTLPECQPSTPASEPTAIEAAQLDSDGKLDLVIADAGDLSVLVLRGNGNGTFAAPEAYVLSDGPVNLAIADFNGDGRADIAVTLPDSDAVQVLLGRGNGTFDTSLPLFPAGPTPSSLIAADFNNDGRMDLATASELNDAIVVLLNGVSPPLFTPTITKTPTKTFTRTSTRTPTITRTVTSTPTQTRTGTITHTPTRTLTPSITPTPTACGGDCNGDGFIDPKDVGRVVAILNFCPPCPDGGATAAGCDAVAGVDKQCHAADTDGDGCLRAGDLTRLVDEVNSGICP